MSIQPHENDRESNLPELHHPNENPILSAPLVNLGSLSSHLENFESLDELAAQYVRTGWSVNEEMNVLTTLARTAANENVRLSAIRMLVGRRLEILKNSGALIRARSVRVGPGGEQTEFTASGLVRSDQVRFVMERRGRNTLNSGESNEQKPVRQEDGPISPAEAPGQSPDGQRIDGATPAPRATEIVSKPPRGGGTSLPGLSIGSGLRTLGDGTGGSPGGVGTDGRGDGGTEEDQGDDFDLDGVSETDGPEPQLRGLRDQDYDGEVPGVLPAPDAVAGEGGPRADPGTAARRPVGTEHDTDLVDPAGGGHQERQVGSPGPGSSHRRAGSYRVTGGPSAEGVPGGMSSKPRPDSDRFPEKLPRRHTKGRRIE
jgi:hypothetical protein